MSNLLSRTERFFLLFSMIAGFCIAMEYSITRPALNALFVTAYGPEAFPWVWMGTVPLNFLIIWLYNRYLPTLGPVSMMGRIIAGVVVVNALSPLVTPHFAPFLFLQLAWKEIYILLMYKQLWSMIHATISMERARVLYGVLYLMGSLGSLAGSFVPAFMAPLIGTARFFWISPFLYAIIGAAFWAAFRHSRAHTYREAASGSATEAIRMIGRNRTLLGVLLLVIFMQITVALADYRFQFFLAQAEHLVDLRTQLAGRVFGAMNLLSFLFQLIGGVFLVHTIGLRRAHFIIPVALLALTGLLTLNPTFAMAAIVLAVTKSVDFSLFGVIREMLWVPLQLDEKYRAKAIIDVFAYRTAKAFASLLLLGLQLIPGIGILPLVNGLGVAVFVGWLAAVYWLLPSREAPSRVAS